MNKDTIDVKKVINKIGSTGEANLTPANLVDGIVRDEDYTVIAHIGFEYRNLVAADTITVKDDFSEEKERELDTQIRYTREFVTTLVMTPEAAVKIGSWIMKDGEYALTKRDETKK